MISSDTQLVWFAGLQLSSIQDFTETLLMLRRASGAGLPFGRILGAKTSSQQPRSLDILAQSRRLNTLHSSTASINTRRLMSSHHGGESTLRPEPDKVLQDIADYVHNYKIDSDLAFETARLCLIDTIGCGLEGLRFPECAKLLGPVVEGTIVPNGTIISTTKS